VKVELRDKLDAYKAHVARVLVLAGTAPAKSEAAAGDVIAIETEIAKLTKTAAEKRDAHAAYSPTDAKALAKQVRTVDWPAYWKVLEVEPSKKLVVASPKLFAQIDKLRARFKPVQWASYLTYHAVQHVGFALPKTYEDEAFEVQKITGGAEKQKERSKRCIDATQTALGELLGQQYVNKYFPASAKTTASMLVDALVRAMTEELGRIDWLAEATRLTAQQKLAKAVRMIGYPDKWRVYDFEVRRDDFAGNSLRALAFDVRRKLAKSGKPVDRSEWPFDTYAVSAYYEPTANNTTLPAGILQPPFFGPDRSVAANLGGIGMLIGHELTHAFDDQGRQFDADGNLKDWWQKDDVAKLETKAK
jgi:putative endopeptidase